MTEAKDYSSTVERVEPGHWRRTYTKDGMTVDLKEEFHSLWFDLTDVSFVQSMSMEVGGVGFFRTEDSYREGEYVTAKGHLDRTSLEYIDKQEGDPWRIGQVDVLLRFERAWNDPPIQKYNSKGKKTEETWTLGESQAGSLWTVDGPSLPHDRNEPFQSLNLKIPRDFLPKLKEAAEHPEKVGRVRMGVMVKLFEEGAQGAFSRPGDHLDFMIDRENQALAYLQEFSIESAAALPSPKKQVEDDGLSYRPPIAEPPAPPPTYGKEIALGLKLCCAALVAIAVVLFLK